ncbi:glycine betaine/L-proline ABC transporter substrate-binding protein ProX [Ottowia thiooxydans]|uniref:Glycine betaine/proline transport system substrate-binding protein n=1 Tax=Ottowia thiooxydans TaxID=219182 RepID=A0ABV2QF45_9BURK
MTPNTFNSLSLLRRASLAIVSAALLSLTPAAHASSDLQLPGKGVRVQPLKSSIAEETFQTLLAMKALEKLGYEVQPIREVEYPTAHLAIANGDATFLAAHWDPMHGDFYKNSGGDAKLWRENTYVADNIQGYLIDKKTADEHNITNMSQLAERDIAKLFDTDGDGRANLTGCTPGWGCETMIETHLTAYKLRDTVQHQQGSYPALMADVIARYKAGQPVLYYTWTPYWVSNVLVPGKDVVWLQVPFSALPGDQAGVDTTLPNGRNYGSVINHQRILANRAFIEAHPDAAKLFSLMNLSVADITAQNNAMNDGKNSAADIERQTEGWIKAHQTLFDDWLSQARAAASR